MEAATLERPVDSSESGAVEFLSTDQNLRLVKDPTRRVLATDTGEAFVKQGVTAEFDKGRLVVSNDASDLLEFLRDHPQNQANGGNLFSELGNEPDNPGDEAAVLSAIVQAVADRDSDRLLSIYLAERNSARDSSAIATAAAQGLEALDVSKPAPEPTPVHQLERYRDESVVASVGAATPAERSGQVDNQGVPIQADYGNEPAPVSDSDPTVAGSAFPDPSLGNDSPNPDGGEAQVADAGNVTAVSDVNRSETDGVEESQPLSDASGPPPADGEDA